MKTYHHGDLRASLVREARSALRTTGMRELSLRSVAHAVGVTHPAAYHHFRSREALLATVAAEALDELCAVLEEAERSSEVGPREAIIAIASAYVGWAMDNPSLFRVAFSEELWDKTPYPELRAASDRASGPVLRQVRALTPQDSDLTRELSVLIWCQAHGTAALAVNRQLAQGGLHVHGGNDGAVAAAAQGVTTILAGWPPR